MELDMGVRGERFVQFLREQLLERKGKTFGYKDNDFADELGIPATTLSRWLNSSSIDRLDLDTILDLDDKFNGELIRYLKQRG